MRPITARLADTTLPIMPATVLAVRQMVGVQSTRTSQLQPVLANDPAASIAVFRALERVRPGAYERVVDAAHAVSMLGMQIFVELIDSLPVVSIADDRQNLRNSLVTAYSQGAHAAVYVQSLAAHRGLNRHLELATAALLQNPAVMSLWVLEPESALRATNAVRAGVSPEIAFGAELRRPLDDVNRSLAAAWAFPRLAQQVMGDWDDFATAPRLIKLADGLAHLGVCGWEVDRRRVLMGVLGDMLDTGEAQATHWLHTSVIDAAHRLVGMDYPLAAFDLLLIDESEDDDEVSEPSETVTQPLEAQVVEPDTTPSPAECPATPAAVPEASAQTPPETPAQAKKPAAISTPNLNDTMAAVMRQIRDQAGTERVIFVMLNRDRSKLRTRLALGSKDTALSDLSIDVGSKSLFSILLDKPKSIWLNRDNAAKYRAYLPEPLRGVLDTQGAFMMSLFVGDRPLGIMYGDGNAITEQGYRRFRVLCNEATATLAAGSRIVKRKDTAIPRAQTN